MYIIVVGGGRVGYYLAKSLISEGHEILLIERDARQCGYIRDELGDVVLRGDGCEVAILEEAGCNRADMLLAVTGGDEDNLVACQVSKARFNVPKTVARINNPKNREIFRMLGIDVTVSSTEIILEHIEQDVPTHSVTHLAELTGGEFELVSVRVPAAGRAVGKRLRELTLPRDAIVAVVIGKQGPAVPAGDSVLAANDLVIAVVRPANEPALRDVLTGT